MSAENIQTHVELERVKITMAVMTAAVCMDTSSGSTTKERRRGSCVGNPCGPAGTCVEVLYEPGHQCQCVPGYRQTSPESACKVFEQMLSKPPNRIICLHI
eukprot:SM000005S17281  [mRNA]  locus=s5:1140504:1141897:- [translate_table: standard]